MPSLPTRRLPTAPTLRCGHDAEVAARLKEYVLDAGEALRKIIIAGLFIDYVISQVAHGRMEAWLGEHCPGVSLRTLRGWREIAKKVIEHCDPERARVDDIRSDPARLLCAPEEDLPGDLRGVRQRIEDLIAGKSYRQLTFEFKQCEPDAAGELKVKRGRRKGDGGYHPKHVMTDAEREEEGNGAALLAMHTARTAIESIMSSIWLTNMSVADLQATMDAALLLTQHLRTVIPIAKRREAAELSQARQ